MSGMDQQQILSEGKCTGTVAIDHVGRQNSALGDERPTPAARGKSHAENHKMNEAQKSCDDEPSPRHHRADSGTECSVEHRRSPHKTYRKSWASMSQPNREGQNSVMDEPSKMTSARSHRAEKQVVTSTPQEAEKPPENGGNGGQKMRIC